MSFCNVAAGACHPYFLVTMPLSALCLEEGQRNPESFWVPKPRPRLRKSAVGRFSLGCWMRQGWVQSWSVDRSCHLWRLQSKIRWQTGTKRGAFAPWSLRKHSPTKSGVLSLRGSNTLSFALLCCLCLCSRKPYTPSVSEGAYPDLHNCENKRSALPGRNYASFSCEAALELQVANDEKQSATSRLFLRLGN